MSYKKYSLKEQLEIIQAFVDGKSIRVNFTYSKRSDFEWNSFDGYENESDTCLVSTLHIMSMSNSMGVHTFDFENNAYEIVKEPRRLKTTKSGEIYRPECATGFCPDPVEYIELTDEVKEKLGIE